MDMDGGQVTAWETDKFRVRSASVLSNMLPFSGAPSYTAEVGREYPCY